ncbi:MAG: peptidoglycan editing factor PgeF [Bacillota bacterium]|nr:peptidoglycan editing factor PgeF [Bacillota bacterium]
MAFTKQTKDNVVFHTSDNLSAAGCVAHGFATRLGGVSTGPCAELNLGLSRHDRPEAVRENYARFCAAVGADKDRLVMTHQVHQDTVRVAGEGDILADLFDPIPYDADGLVTNQPGLCLTIYYADCIPVLLCDPVKKVIAAVHSGWRGTALAIAPKAVRKMADLYGSRPENILAAIGPGIGPCCFETHDDVPTAMAAQLGDGVRDYIKTLETPGKFSVDLKGILTWQLTAAGLTLEHVEVLTQCTGCHPELWWSHRKLGDRRGNQAAMIQLLP